MGAFIVITPLLVAGWPAITAAVTAAVASMGFTLAQSAAPTESFVKKTVRTEIDVQDSEILHESAGSGEELVIHREGVRGVFSRDARGALKLCLEAKGRTEAELKNLGEEIIGRVTQQYAYHRIVTELKQRNMSIVDEQVTADQTVKIRVRNW
jgi:hypothetical protein